LLDHDRAKGVVLGVLNSQLAHRKASCVGFVVMPDHVHAIVWYSEEKEQEKLTYMRENPVRAGLVARPCDWVFSSARFDEEQRSVGVPIRWIA
jgi:putative transposase